ncbi:hypothetical protein B0H10DRAFT_1922686 [Mycena sp. CBHHK59/15]|nr:hypothetical protein B0H10DRAFT_1922686 [Mycena sp. CBHHK59/15]
MHFLNVAVLALLPLIPTVLSVPSRRDDTSGTISTPVNGAVIAPGAAFDFRYNTMADYGVTSYNYSVWLLTSMPTTFEQSTNFAEGHFFGRFAEPNYPGMRVCNPSPKNPAPAQLIMPDFSKNPGGWGAGASDSNGQFALVVMEEYANGSGSVGSRLALAVNSIVYNGTTS